MAINEIEHCEHTEVHAETVRAVREHMPAEDELYDLAELFKVFGDSTRIRILFALFEADICEYSFITFQLSTQNGFLFSC